MVRLVAGIAIGVLTLTAVPAGAEDEHQYVGVKKCRSCHKKELIGNQYGEWKEGVHAGAYKTLKGEKALEVAKEKGLTEPPHEADECLKCHVTAYGLDARRFAKKPLRHRDAVQCESCHGAGKDYRKKKTHSDREKSISKGMWEPGKDEKICTTCHNVESPSWDPAKYTLVGGTTVGFDFEQAKERIRHPIPEDVKGKYLEIEEKLRAEKKARGEAVEEDEEEDDE